MHQALQIPEVARLIVQHCADNSWQMRGTMRSLRLTCKSFSDPAIAFQWQELGSIEPLLSMLPPDLWSNRTLQRDATLGDVLLLKQRASHVLDLTIYCKTKSERRGVEALAEILLALELQEMPIFRKVRIASIWLAPKLTAPCVDVVCKMFGTSLVDFTLLGPMATSERLSSLAALMHRTPNVTAVNVDQGSVKGATKEALCRVLSFGPWQSLRLVTSTVASSAQARAILQLPQLQELHLQLSAPFVNDYTTANDTSRRVSVLTSLTLDADKEDTHPVSTFELVLKCLSEAPVVDLTLNAKTPRSGLVQRDELATLMACLSRNDTMNPTYLTHLKIMALTSNLWDEDETIPDEHLDDPYCLRFLTQFSNLETLEILFYAPQATALEPIAVLGAHAPRLEVLHLGYLTERPNPELVDRQEYVLTLDDVVAIAKAFPQLKTLHVPLFSAYEEGRRLNGGGFQELIDDAYEHPNLRELHVGYPRLTEDTSSPVALFLTTRFPALKQVGYVEDHKGRRDLKGRQCPWEMVNWCMEPIVGALAIERGRQQRKLGQ